MSDSDPIDSTEALSRNGRWLTAAVAICLFLGLLICFFLLSGWSWTGLMIDLIFPPVVGVLTVAVAILVWRRGVPGTRKWYFLALSPALLTGGLSLVLAVILAVPPFTLGLMFLVGETMSATVIQSAPSPDQNWVAHVYFTPAGAERGGNGTVDVTVSPRLLPFVERGVYRLPASEADETTRRHVDWTSPHSLVVVGEPGGKQEHIGF